MYVILLPVISVQLVGHESPRIATAAAASAPIGTPSSAGAGAGAGLLMSLLLLPHIHPLPLFTSSPPHRASSPLSNPNIIEYQKYSYFPIILYENYVTSSHSASPILLYLPQKTTLTCMPIKYSLRRQRSISSSSIVEMRAIKNISILSFLT